MIDRCDPNIATWSTTGDSFLVKHCDKFSSDILPLYFKHGNFSRYSTQNTPNGMLAVNIEVVVVVVWDDSSFL